MSVYVAANQMFSKNSFFTLLKRVASVLKLLTKDFILVSTWQASPSLPSAQLQ